MTTKHKLTLLAGTAIALAATPALAQTVVSAQPNGGAYFESGFISDGSTPTITNNNVVPGVSYDSTNVQTGTETFSDWWNTDVAGGVTVNGNAWGNYDSTETTVTHVDLVVPANTVTYPSTYNNTGGTANYINVYGSNSTGTAITNTNITTDSPAAVGNSVNLTQTVSSIDSTGITFATYTGTATYQIPNPNAGVNNYFDVNFNTTPVSGTTLDQNGLTTTGVVDTPVVQNSNGSLLLQGNGPSYVQVNDNSVVIHGGTSSTTGTFDNAGFHVVDTGNGLIFDVDSNGNGYFLGNVSAVDGNFSGNVGVGGNLSVTGTTTLTGVLNANGGINTTTINATSGNFTGNVQAATFTSQSGAYFNQNSSSSQNIWWNDGTNYYYNDAAAWYNQIYWSDGTNSSYTTQDYSGIYASNNAGNYANHTAYGFSTNGDVTTNTLNATTATIGTVNSTTINNSGATNTGSLAVTNNATVGGNLAVTGTTTLTGALTANGGATVNNGLTVNGGSTLNGGATVNGLLTANNGATIANGLTVTSGGANITGNSSVTGNLGVSGTTTTGALAVTNNASVGGNLAVTGTTTLTGALTANGGVSTTNLVTSGTATVGTNLTVMGTTDVRGAIFNGGTANGGAVYVNDALTVTGNVGVGTVVINSSTNKISGLANATLSSSSTEAVTGQQLFATNTALATLDAREAAHYSLLNHRADKAYQGVAMGFAMNAAPLNLDDGEGGISAGVGVFEGQWGGAIKAQFVTESGFGIGANLGFSEDAVGGGVGASIKF